MRSPKPRFRAAALVAAAVCAVSICGASPQEGRTPHPRPETIRETPAPSSMRSPGGSGVEGRVPFQPNRDRGDALSGRGSASGRFEGREPHPRPLHRTLEDQASVTTVGYYPGTQVVIPPAWRQCVSLPDMTYWYHRDLMAEIRWLSRRGFIPVTPLGDSVDILSDYVAVPAGWRAYGIAVPPGGTVQVEVEHEKLAWFRLMLVDKWGQPGPGMLQAAMAYRPILVTYKNPGKAAQAVYVIVDDPAWWSGAKDPYTLKVRRDWDPASVDLTKVKMVAGLWGASPSVSAAYRRPSLTGPAVFPH